MHLEDVKIYRSASGAYILDAQTKRAAALSELVPEYVAASEPLCYDCTPASAAGPRG
jgi:hypothetical protein